MDGVMGAALAAGQLCALLFCWSTTALLGECGAAVIWPGAASPIFRRAIEYTVLVVIATGAGMIALGVAGWLGDVVVPALVAAQGGNG